MDISTGGRAYLNAVESSLVQANTTSIAGGLQKWVERSVSPDMFATPDSCILCFSPHPTATKITSTDSLQVIGLAQGINFGSQMNVLTYQELRTERHIIIPLKSTPGQLSINRVMGAFPSLHGLLTSQGRWSKNTQKASAKKLCCIILIFMNMVRSNTLGTLIFERCALNSDNTAVNAGDYSVIEQLSFTYDKIVDTQKVTATASTQDSSTSTSTSTDGTSTTSSTTEGTSDTGGTSTTSNTTATSSTTATASANAAYVQATARRYQTGTITKNMYLEVLRTYQYALRKINEVGVDRNTTAFAAYQTLVSMYESNLQSGFNTMYVSNGTIDSSSFNGFIRQYSLFIDAITTYKNRGVALP